MKREIYSKLLDWKVDLHRKPLILLGARQVGKTYILKEFGKNEYDKVFYFNFEENKQISDFFKEKIDPEQIIKNLSIYTGDSILQEKHLIFFDEIQLCNNALNSLKYFNELSNDYHIVSAGSLLGIRQSGPKSFPVGKVNIMHLYPMNFKEFLLANEGKKLSEFIENTDKIRPYPEPIHNKLIELLKYYYLIGGMPEVVRIYIESKRVDSIRKIQNEILLAFQLDFSKYAEARDIPKLSLIWKSIPKQLSKENKKFIFTAVAKSARAREYENAIIWLEDNSLIHRSYRASKPNLPLSGYMDSNIYKVFLLDIGLLGAMSKIDMKSILFGNKIFTDFKGAFTENFVAQELKSIGNNLYYWESNGKAEVDFLIESEGKIRPIEVKAGISTKNKSLKEYGKRYSPDKLIRTNLLNLSINDKITNIPLYALSILHRI